MKAKVLSARVLLIRHRRIRLTEEKPRYREQLKWYSGEGEEPDPDAEIPSPAGAAGA
jgi:hypothetical protein